MAEGTAQTAMAPDSRLAAHREGPAQPPLVSGIIIFFNGEQFLREAIESVLTQTYSNWELLLCDDGSTDASPTIAREYAAACPDKVRYLEHPGHANLGMSAARNLGVRHARGRYLAFLDADDVWLPNKLHDQTAILEAHPQAAMLFGRTRIWYGWTGRPQDQAKDYITRFPFRPNALVPPPQLLVHFLGSEEHLPCTCSILVRREIAEHVGGFEDQFRGAYEDLAFYSKIFLTEPVLFADGCWDCYRQHPHSTCAQAIVSGEHHPTEPNRARQAYLRFVEGHLRRQGISKGAVWEAVQQQLWPYRHPLPYRLSRLARRALHGANRLLRGALPSGLHHRLAATGRRWLRRPGLGRR